jgi:NAD(P)-dependent dehydrogenase (short-subunit alcohol dehydrogenase family)
VYSFGALYLAFNDAGILGEVNPIAEFGIEAWCRVIDINLNAVFYGLHYQIPAILKSGGRAIVNTASLEYADQSIRINSVHPGYIQTPLIGEFEELELVKLHSVG